MKEICLGYVNEKVTRTDLHPKFMAPDGIIRLLIAREWKVNDSFEMFKKWVVSCALLTDLSRTGDLTLRQMKLIQRRSRNCCSKRPSSFTKMTRRTGTVSLLERGFTIQVKSPLRSSFNMEST